MVANPSGVKRYNLGTPNRRRISKAAARGHKKAVVHQCFADPQVQTYTIKKVSQIIRSELKAMCSLQICSVLRNNTNGAIKSFKWSSFLDELEVNAPVIYKILLASTKTKKPRPNQLGVIGMCIAILLRHRCDKMNLVHKIIWLNLVHRSQWKASMHNF